MKVSSKLSKLLNILTVIFLAGMSILVFSNVVLRYVFNSGITWSEEIARFLFVGLIFLSAISALKDNQHLKLDFLTKRLSNNGKKLIYTIISIIMLYVLYIVFDGSFKLTMMNMNTLAPASGIPMAFIYGIGILVSIGMASVILFSLYRIFIKKENVDHYLLSNEVEESFEQNKLDEEAKR